MVGSAHPTTTLHKLIIFHLAAIHQVDLIGGGVEITPEMPLTNIPNQPALPRCTPLQQFRRGALEVIGAQELLDIAVNKGFARQAPNGSARIRATVNE